ncbi:hypothetical protein [Thiomonas sp.]|jgi:hypothetical protein|uniref:hypothetical protein n=1 Tax=Thiomonas sp. TaxID=2047785 RepID=UPI0026180F16|nr:hypothetical protein [Thiomonas sp.]
MDHTSVSAMLHALQDPAGLPAPAWLFQYLNVLTWAFHIAFVNLALGTALLAIIAFMRRHHPGWAQLSVAMTGVAKVAVSMAIVLGVAPLLFTQTIYDPSWYTSNLLSAFWVIFFIFSLGIGYTLWFVFYFKNHDVAHAAQAKDATVWWATVALCILVFDGFIMHVLSYQGLFPQKWMQWYAPQGIPVMNGTGIHAFELPRFAFFMVMSLTMTGVFLLGYARYFRARSDVSADYLDLAHRIGVKTTYWGVALQLLTGVLWAYGLPSAMHVFAQPLFWLTALLIVGVALYARQVPVGGSALQAYAAMAFYALLALIVSVDREALRVAYLAPFHYDLASKPHVEWGAVVWFFATFIGVGGSLVAFYSTMLWKAGKVKGLYTADGAVSRLGSTAVFINFTWLAVFFAIGVWAYVRNIAA